MEKIKPIFFSETKKNTVEEEAGWAGRAWESCIRAREVSLVTDHGQVMSHLKLWEDAPGPEELQPSSLSLPTRTPSTPESITTGPGDNLSHPLTISQPSTSGLGVPVPCFVPRFLNCGKIHQIQIYLPRYF